MTDSKTITIGDNHSSVDEQAKQHTISMLVENHFGTLNRIAGLFAAKGYNIDSLTVGPTEEADVSRMTIVTRGDDQVIEQIMKQLHKLIDTIKVVDLTFESYVERELALIKVQSTATTRSEIMQVAESAEGRSDHQYAETVRHQRIVANGPRCAQERISGRSMNGRRSPE
jgi:acetolactate synthase small subunit